MRRTAALIVGGGPAGASAAMTLARAGAPHLLIERTREPGDALCGGFLSWRSLETLAALGIAPDELNPHPVRRVRMIAGGQMAEAALPRPGIGVSRHRLDTLLMARAIAAGAAVERGVAVRALDGGAARLADGTVIDAPAILLATGKHDVRGGARPVASGGDPAIGLRVRLAPSPRLARLIGDAIELHAINGGYAGLVLQEDGSANLCLAVRRSRLQAAGSPARLLVAIAAAGPALADRLGVGDPGSIDAIANVPYGWRARTTTAGLFRLGDQAGVIPSLAGEGMGIALASGTAAAHALIADGPSGAIDFQRAFAQRLARPLAIAGIARAAAESPVLAPLMVAGARLAPGAVDAVARLTRISRFAVDPAVALG